MDYSEACTELARLIRSDHFEYDEEAGLAIQILNQHIDDGDDPKMALAFAKHLDRIDHPRAAGGEGNE